jgi:cytochrome P450
MSTDSMTEVDPLDLVSPKRYGQSVPPHDVWRTLREHDPVHWCEPEGFESFWAITRHEDITEISSQPEVFSNALGIVVLNDQQIAAQEQGDSPLRAMRTIIEMDPPNHRIYRKIAERILHAARHRRARPDRHVERRALVDSLGDEVNATSSTASRSAIRCGCSPPSWASIATTSSACSN